MIDVQQLFKRFGSFEALKSISFSVASGEAVGLLGENGAGKSTTMRILAGFLPPTSGQVRVAGCDVVFESNVVRRNIGYLPESVPIYGSMRVSEYLTYRARLKGLRGRQVKERVDTVLSEVDLVGRRRSLVQTLSKGLRQRVGLADALVHEPKLLILDEPTSGLDPSQRREVRDIIRGLHGRHTIIVSSHILPEVETTCERVVVLHEGRIAAQSSIAEIRSQGDKCRFYVVVAADVDLAMSSLRELPDLKVEESVVATDGSVRIELSAPQGAQARAAVARALVAAGVDLTELGPLGTSLEDAFLRLIGKTEEG